MYVAPISDVDEAQREAYGITREFKDKINELIEAINDLDTRLQALES
tara:strand:+ start:4990 stop:5130 length:141 start_codon:yes stop_codon:yes gene_type:complete